MGPDLESRLDQLVRDRDWAAAAALLADLGHAAPCASLAHALHAALAAKDGDRIEGLTRLLLGLGRGAEGLTPSLALSLHLGGRRGLALDCYRRLIAAGEASVVPQAAAILAGVGRYEEALLHLQRSPAHRASDQHLGLLCAARRYNDARDLALERFRASAQTVTDHVAAIDWLVRSGEPAAALALVAAAPAAIKSDPTIAWYGRLYGHLLGRLARVADCAAPTAGPRDLLVSVIAWGADYAERLGAVTLASLAAPGNLPAFAADRRVTLRIYTDLVGRMILQRAPALRALERAIAVEFDIIPDALLQTKRIRAAVSPQYLLLGMFAHLSVIEAGRTGRDAMLLGADCIYSNRFCAHLRDLAADGREVISVSVGFSANDSMLDALGPWRRDAAIDIESEDLVDLGFAHMHHRTRTGCVDAGASRRTSMPAMMFFREAWGLAYRKLGVDLTYLANPAIRAAGKFDYQTPDGEMPDRIVPPGEWHRIHRVSDSRDAILVELIPDAQLFPEIEGESLSPLHVVGYADTYGFLNYMRQCFLYETRLTGRGPPPWPGDEDHGAFIEETRRLLFEL